MASSAGPAHLAVVHMTHDRHHRRPRLQVLQVILINEVNCRKGESRVPGEGLPERPAALQQARERAAEACAWRGDMALVTCISGSDKGAEGGWVQATGPALPSRRAGGAYPTSGRRPRAGSRLGQ